MSGLEPLVALGLACNILQIVDTAKNSVSICRNILESGSVDPALDARAHDLTKICEELKSRQHVATGASCTFEQQELIALAQSTINTAAELKTEIDKLSSNSSKGKRLGALKGALKANWRKSRIEKLEKNMLDTQRILETRLLARICSQNDALTIKQREDFSALGDKLCTFVSNYEQGKRDIESLLRKGFISVETHVTAEASQTRREIATKVDEVFAKEKDSEDVKRLLASLRYPSMNERRNQISGTHEGTFEWIFGPEPDLSDSDESSMISFDDETYFNKFPTKSESEGEIESVNLSESKSEGNRHIYDPVFVNWLQSPDQSLFWINGKPGAGKSTLMKFLLEDDRTREYLNQAHPNTLLISHFIWSAGDPTQRSLRGLLCSLLHQLVTGIEGAPNFLLGVSKISQLKMKEAPGDWSVKELKAAVISVIKHSETPVCILVDGLDEIDTADGPFVLLDAITQLRHIAGVKILVSSRPEPAFMRGLKDAPFLRVQDLTRRGIFRYVKDQLASFVDKYPCAINDNDIRSLSRKVSVRANGVFLWASLALKSLERGFLNGDSETYLQQRLEGLPDDLNALYKNMWDRLNEDTEIYREEAAKYLNFAILALEVMDSSGLLRMLFQPYAIVHQLASETWMAKRILEDLDTMTEQDIQSIHKGLSAFLHTITVRCAGILEINRPELYTDKMAEMGSTGSDWLVTIGFVHRSGREFLCNTAYGREILQHDRSKPQDRFCAFLEACMARDRLLPNPIPSSLAGGFTLSAQSYTFLCCVPKFGLSLQEILDIIDCMENQKIFMRREPGSTMNFTAEKIGMLVFMGRPDAAISSLERAERLNGPVSATYLRYLLVLAMQGSWFSWSDSVDGKLSRAAMVSSLLSSGRKININTRVPVISLGNQASPIHKFAQEYPNSPLLDIFLVESLCRTSYDTPPHLLKYTLQICHLLLGHNPTLETRTLLFLMSSRGELNEESTIVDLGSASLYSRTYRSSHIVMLEVDTRYLLGLLCARLAPQVRDNDRILAEKLALFETVIGDTPAWVEVVGVLPGAQVARDGGEGKVIVPNKLDASRQEVQQPRCIKGLQDLRSVTRKSEDSGRTSCRFQLPGCPNIQHLINSFEYGTREVELGVFYEPFIERGLVVTNREVNPETWPPPRHDPPE